MDRKKKVAKYNRKVRSDVKKYIQDFKRERCCVKCGYKEHTKILHFHHLEKGGTDMSQMCRQRCSLAKIKEEIGKCVLLCPNCHYWVHRKDKDW